RAAGVGARVAGGAVAPARAGAGALTGAGRGIAGAEAEHASRRARAEAAGVVPTADTVGADVLGRALAVAAARFGAHARPADVVDAAPARAVGVRAAAVEVLSALLWRPRVWRALGGLLWRPQGRPRNGPPPTQLDGPRFWPR